MKKIIALLLMLVMISVLFVGCSDRTENGNKVYEVCEGVHMIRVSMDGEFGVYVHKETRVMYLASNWTYSGGVTVMLDANGSPMSWGGEL